MSETSSPPKDRPLERVAWLQKEIEKLASHLQSEFEGKLVELMKYYVAVRPEMRIALYDSDTAKDALKNLTLRHLRLDVTPDEILAFIGDKKKIKKDIVKYFDFSTPIITKRLKELVAANKLKTEGSKKATVYLKA